jgi:hypothetical protein
MSWYERFRQLLAPPCERCGEPTVIESEHLLATFPAVFEVIGRCPACAATASRCQAVADFQ